MNATYEDGIDVAARPDLNVISLCAGGGGLDLGLRLAEPRARTVVYVEREVTEAAVLAKGIEAGLLDDAPIWSDLLSFDAGAWRGLVHGVVGGFPCQPHSFAGKRLGEDDKRNLWPAVARVVFDAAPEFCFFENVPGIAAFYWRVIRPDLQALGYEVEEGIFSAEEVGAPHLRERLFILAVRNGSGFGAYLCDLRAGQPDAAGRVDELADSTSARSRGLPVRARQSGHKETDALGSDPELVNAKDKRSDRGERSRRWRPGPPDASCNVANTELSELCISSATGTDSAGAITGRTSEGVGDTDRQRSQGCRPTFAAGCAFPPGPSDHAGWQRWLDAWPGTEPALRRDADGLAFRADRLRVLGNGVVPAVAATAFRELSARFGVQL